MKDLFSINKAADLLERDRATLVRALRRVEPNGTENGQLSELFSATEALLQRDPRLSAVTGIKVWTRALG